VRAAKVINIVARIGGALLGLGGVLGAVWFAYTAPVTSFAIPLAVFLLSVTPEALVRRYWGFALLALAACIVDLVARGIPFLRTFADLDVEIMSVIQLVLLVYLSACAFSADGKPASSLRNLLP
jgi:hypothetical protein